MTPRLSRRTFVAGLSAGAAFYARGAGQAWSQAEYPFTLGVASGDPSANSVVLWTRLAPRPLAPAAGMGAEPVAVEWEVFDGGDGALGPALSAGVVNATADRGHAVHVLVRGLSPARRYRYRFGAGGHRSPVGRTATLPAPGAAVTAMTFAVAGCQRIEHGFFGAWRAIAEDDALDFVFHYGDYIYESAITAAAARRYLTRDRLGTAIDLIGVADNLESYRQRYALYRLDRNLQAAHRNHPFLCSYDDHEVVNDWAGEKGDGNGRPFLERRAAALQAYYENMPIAPASTAAGAIGYRGFEFAGLCRISVLDTRLYRERQSMLGQPQEDWLKARLTKQAPLWNIVAQQVPMMTIRLPGGGVMKDKWDGFPSTRKRLLDHVAGQSVTGFVGLSGDLHRAVAGELSPGFREGEKPVGVEFTAASVTSRIPGKPDNYCPRNPHLRFYDERHGYLRCSATSEKMTARFMASQDVASDSVAFREAARFDVDPHRAGLDPSGICPRP